MFVSMSTMFSGHIMLINTANNKINNLKFRINEFHYEFKINTQMTQLKIIFMIFQYYICSQCF